MFHHNISDSQYYCMVFAEKCSNEQGNFEENFSKFIREKKGTKSVHICYKHGVGNLVQDLNACISQIDMIFGDIGETTLNVKKMEDQKSGRLVILEWKNPRQKRTF